jgi:signal transduction histidine kinase/ActR/RegA family two-component response regulator
MSRRSLHSVLPAFSDGERARAEATLRESDARLQLALDASGMGTFLWHLDDDRGEPDARTLALFGLPTEGAVSLTAALSKLIHPDDRTRYAEAVTEAIDPAGSGEFREEIRILHPSGEERWLSISGQTLFEPATAEGGMFPWPRRAIRMAGVVGDITERKRREANRSFLADLANDLARLSSAEEIMQTVGEKVGAYLELSCSCFIGVDESRDEGSVEYVWRAHGRPALPKTARLSVFVTEDFRRASRSGETVVVCDTESDSRVHPTAYGPIRARAFVSVPFVRDGALKSLLIVCDERPRIWREDEIRLCRELSTRLVPRLERACTEQAMANDLRDTRLLRDLSVRLVSEDNEHLFFDAIVSAALAITGASGGSLHLLDPETSELVLLAMRSSDGEEPRIGADAGPRSAQSTPLVTRCGRTIGMLSTYWPDHRRLSERELRFLDLLARQAAETIERRRTDDALRDSERRLSAELADTKLLQAVSSQLIKEQDSMTLYETIVDAATSIMHSEFASLQMLYPERGAGGELKLIASRGFSDDAKKIWQWVTRDHNTTCGAALRFGVRVIAPDIAQCDFMAGTRDQAWFLQSGVRASQTTPLVSRAGRMLGMLTTLWREPHQPSERDLRLLDLLARQAADLMERMQAEETLRRNEAELKEADRRKDEFLAVLAHELRNPLAPLRTGLELIRLAGDTAAAVEEVRVMMEEQVAHMVRLIDDLLDVSRITSGKIRLQRQPTALVTLVNAAVEANQAAIGAARVALSIELPPVPVVLDADPTRVIQVLSNILHNAVKFTGPGGRIRVAAELRHAADEAVGEIVLTVSDSGAGISREMLPRVFDLFTQDDSVTHRLDAGLGIGLALARQLVEMHGGTIDVQSDGPGLGSTFSVRLPLSRDVVTPRTPSPVPIPRIARRVVVVDDNVPAATAMKRFVTALGGDCRVAYDGATGIAHVREFHPDVVLLDIGMPGMDGYETCRRIRREFGFDVIVVALTGWGQERDKQEAARAGFDVHLAKPADPLVLERLLMDTRPVPPRKSESTHRV